MIELLILLQTIFLILQLFCLGYCVKNNINPVEYPYGYAIWGCIPNILTGMLIRGLS